MLQSGHSYSSVVKELGCSKATVAHHARAIGRPANRIYRRSFDKLILIDLASTCGSVSEILRTLGIAVSGSSFASLRSAMKRFGIQIPNGRVDGAGRIISPILIEARKKKVLDFLKPNTTIGTHSLKLQMFRYGIKQKACEKCGITEWMGEAAPLELHHINGVKTDGSIENLQILCPNCHAQTPTYCAKNIKSRRSIV